MTRSLSTPDGSYTAYNDRFDETYGSRHGAATQARQVFLEGSQTHLHSAPRVLEIGFGLGLNFRTTLQNTLERGVPLQYVAYEFDPVSADLLCNVSQDDKNPFWNEILDRWDECIQKRCSLKIERPELSLCIHWEDVLKADLPHDWASALYLDGFSPQKNPEVWSESFIQKLAKALQSGGILSTYSAAGHVRRSLIATGLHTEKMPGALGKRESLRAIKP